MKVQILPSPPFPLTFLLDCDTFLPMRYLIFDDDDGRQAWFLSELAGHDVVQAWNVEQALEALKGPRFDYAFLDHDIVDKGKTRPGWAKHDGRDLVKALLKMSPETRPKGFHVHSWNVTCAAIMENKLKDAGCVVSRAPYGQFKLKLAG